MFPTVETYKYLIGSNSNRILHYHLSPENSAYPKKVVKMIELKLELRRSFCMTCIEENEIQFLLLNVCEQSC